MAKDYKEIAADLTSSMGRLQKGIPDTMKGFAAMGAAAKASGALDAKTKELIAIAIAVAVRCDGCIAAHTRVKGYLLSARSFNSLLAFSFFSNFLLTSCASLFSSTT